MQPNAGEAPQLANDHGDTFGDAITHSPVAVWLLNLDDPATYATPQETANCHVSDATPTADTPASNR